MTSDMWHFFQSQDLCNDGKLRAKYKGCGKVYVVAGSKYGTSTLSCHLTSCKKKHNYGDVSKMLINHEGKLTFRRT